MISEAQLARYRSRIDGNTRAAGEYVESVLAEVAAEGAGDDELMGEAQDAVATAADVFGEQAANDAAEAYDEWVGDLGLEPAYPADYLSDPDVAAALERGAAAAAVGASLIDIAASAARDEVSNQANRTIYVNANRPSDIRAGVTYARVPRGDSHVCGFCYMLASRGFTYGSEKAAGNAGSRNRYHSGCRCTVVASADGRVAGYDHNGMYSRYAKCRDAVTPYGAQTNLDSIAREIERRDPGWLLNGAVPGVSVAKDADPTPSDMDIARRIAAHGYAVQLKPADGGTVARINGRLWALSGDGEQTGGRVILDAAKLVTDEDERMELSQIVAGSKSAHTIALGRSALARTPWA